MHLPPQKQSGFTQLRLPEPLLPQAGNYLCPGLPGGFKEVTQVELSADRLNAVKCLIIISYRARREGIQAVGSSSAARLMNLGSMSPPEMMCQLLCSHLSSGGIISLHRILTRVCAQRRLSSFDCRRHDFLQYKLFLKKQG